MRRPVVTALAVALLLAGPAMASEEPSSLDRANERATSATRGAARDVGTAIERGNERATEATRGTAKKVGKGAQKAAEDLGKAIRGLGKSRND